MRMQRGQVPTINLPTGAAIAYHGYAPGPSGGLYTIYPAPAQNGVIVSQNQHYAQVAPIGPGSFRNPPPPPSYVPAGTYADVGQYGSQYMPAQSHHAGPSFSAPTFLLPMATYPNGHAYAFPQQQQHQTAFVGPGPSALELQAPPTLAMQQQIPPMPMTQMPPSGSNAGMPPQPQQQQGSQGTSMPRREKKVLQIIDPVSGKNISEAIAKEKEEHERSIGTQHHPSRNVWTPAMGQHQQSQVQQPSIVNLPSGATSVEQRPSRSGSGTPHLDQAKSYSARPTSRGQSPAFEGQPPEQNDNAAKLQEFYSQFGQQLASSEQSDQSLSDPQSKVSHQNDSELMPPPAIAPPARALSKGQQRQSQARTPSPTPPPVPNQMHPTKPASETFEFGIKRSSSSSSLARKKPSEILEIQGTQEIQFGWLDVSAGDKSLDTIDGDAIEAELQQNKDGNILGAGIDYCSTPEKQQPPPPDASRSRSPVLDVDPGRKSEIAPPKSPRDRNYLQQPQSAQGLLNGNSSADKVGGTASDAAASAFSGNTSYDQQDSMEEGEIRDMVFEQSLSVNGAAGTTITGEGKATILAVVEQLNEMEAKQGPKRYDHEFMMVAAKLPWSKTRPAFNTDRWNQDNVDEVFNLNRQALQNKIDSRGRPPQQMAAGFAPIWMAGGMIMPPGRPAFPGRSSETGSIRGGKGSRQSTGRGGGKQPPLIIARPSIEVELKTTGNAWKPAHKAEAADDPEVAETKKLFKEVRGILNKIAPQTFEDLNQEFLSLEPRMNTVERASGVVDIVFQKAVDEPSFCTTYSELYDRMTKHQHQQQQPTKGSVNATNRDTNFRWILLNKCQNEFERDKRTEANRKEREAAIANAELPEQKKQLQDALDEFLMKEKRRTLGNMRFIGELYLKNMLTSKIMHRCVMELIKKEDDEESLECLCKLLMTIGAKLDVDDKDPVLQGHCQMYYSRLKELSSGLSSRIRFMILDLLDVRSDAWKPRRKGEGPKTIEQLHRDAAKEKFEQQQELLQEERRKQELSSQEGRSGGGGGGRRDLPNRPSFGAPDHDGRGGRGDRGGDRDQNRQGGRTSAGVGSQQQPPQSSADLSKARAPNLSMHLGGANTEVRLGPPTRKGWGKPSGATGPAAPPPRQPDPVQTRLANRFDQLAGTEGVGGSAPGSRDSSQSRQDGGAADSSRRSSVASTTAKDAGEDVAGDNSGKNNAVLDSARDSALSNVNGFE